MACASGSGPKSARNHLPWLAHSRGLAARRVDAVIEESGRDKGGRRDAYGYFLGMRQLALGAGGLAARRQPVLTCPPQSSLTQ
jgi:ABC-2 type transport system ATP-binding protein